MGTIEVNGFLLTQGNEFKALYSPANGSHLVLTAVDTSCQVEGSTRSQTSVLSGTSQRSCSASQATAPSVKSGVHVDLEQVDAERLGAMITDSGWTDVELVVLLRGIDNALTRCLEAQDGVLPLFKHSLIPGFQTLGPASPRALVFTQDAHQLARDLIAFTLQAAPVVVVSGVSGSGKSSLCRFLINHLLNRHPVVGFLECDVGQTEFTVPGVLALHMVNEPLLGPPFTHLQRATRAYYFGSKSPKTEPSLYGHIISVLFKHFMADTRQSKLQVPLIVNSCGWLTDLGVPIFLELLRTIRPSHLVKLEQDDCDLVPDTLASLSAWSSECHLFPGSVLDPRSLLGVSGSGLGQCGASADHCDDQWEPVVYCLKPQLHRTKNSKLMRKLAYTAYFSPIYSSSALNAASDLQQTVNIGRAFLLLASPRSVAWSSVAVHVLHRKVPSSQLLYAINGKFVTLGSVEEDEIVSHELKHPGMVKTLRSQLPLVKFIGLGLVRGIDVESKRFYITTPEDSKLLSTVNVLVLDQVEDPDSIMSRKDFPVHSTVTVPYHSAEFMSCDIGQYCWKP